MSLKDAFTNQITNRSGAAVNQFISKTLGLDRKKESPIPNIKRKGPFSTKMLSYPIDVGDNPEHGHWIKFEIHNYKQIKLKNVLKGASKATVPQVVKKMAGDNRISKTEQKMNGAHAGAKQSNDGLAIQKIGNFTKKGLKALSGASEGKDILKLKGTRHLVSEISLYMPPSLTVNYKANFEDTEIGVLAETGANIIKAFGMGKEAYGLPDMFSAAVSGGKNSFKKAMIEGVDAIAPGSKALLQIEAGMVLTPRMELMFNGMGRRQFSFSFLMIPKNEREAQTVDQIVYAFKYHAASDVGNIREQTIPDTFDIKYMYRSGENSFLNKISTCYCTDVAVTYGGDRAVFYDETKTTGSVSRSGAPPQRTTITLTFSEMQILGKRDIEQGY